MTITIITGAARGIGFAIARLLLAQGKATDSVALLDIDAEQLRHAHAELIQEFGSTNAARVVSHPCDVSEPVQVQQCIELIGATHDIIGLVNNAGIAVFKPLLDTSFSEWSRVMAVNLNGPFICSQAVVPYMLKSLQRATGAPAIVNIASISGLRASTLRVAYGTSKAALMHLTRQQAVELGNMGIRVNAVAPGPVDTAMAKQVHSPAIRADYAANIPLARYGSEDEIAQSVCFLLSPAASYVNGQTLACDGGFDAAGIGLSDLRKG